jgi:hypothetical protein
MFPIIKTFYPNIILFFEEVRVKKTARRISSTRQAHAKCFCCSFKNYIMVQKRWGKEEKTLSLKWVFLMTVCFSPPVPIRFTRHLRAELFTFSKFAIFVSFDFFAFSFNLFKQLSWYDQFATARCHDYFKLDLTASDIVLCALALLLVCWCIQSLLKYRFLFAF